MRQGRDLELLIKQIESFNIPNATILSPEYVKDVDTGTNREVDVGIRSNKDGVETFLAIECRDRKETEGIGWIEQLMSKKRSVGADGLIAVTSSTFAEPAKVKARKNGIYIRSVSSVTEKEILNLLNETFVEVHSISPKLNAVSLITNEPVDFGKPLEDCAYFSQDRGQSLSFENLVNLVWKNKKFLNGVLAIRNEIPSHNDKISFKADMKLSETIYIANPQKVRLIGLTMSLCATKCVERVPLSAISKYQDALDKTVLNKVFDYQLQSNRRLRI